MRLSRGDKESVVGTWTADERTCRLRGCDWSGARMAGRQRELGALSVRVISAAPTLRISRTLLLLPAPPSILSPSPQNHCGFKICLLRKSPAMDATIYQIIFGELADLNCTLIDALQDTFMENASLSLQSIDGIFFYLKKEEGNEIRAVSATKDKLKSLYFFFRFILQRHNRWDRDLLAAQQ